MISLKKTCPKCLTPRDFETEFYKCKARKDGKQLWCKYCTKAAAADWAKENPIEIRACQLRHRDKHRDELNRRSRASYAKNSQKRLAASAKWRRENPELAKQSVKNWTQKNPISVRLNSHRRRARIRMATIEPVTQTDWIAILEFWQGRCAYCLKCHPNLTMDHIVPIIKGGKHSIDNLVPACGPCNFSKNSSLLSEWKNRPVVNVMEIE